MHQNGVAQRHQRSKRMNHVWGLLAHPNQEMRNIKQENETVSHHYTHHVLLMAAIPVICAIIGTTNSGWNLGEGQYVQLNFLTALGLGILFYLLILGGVAVMGRVIHWMARDYPQRPGVERCTVFAGYVATPLFLSGLVALYPLVWLCVLAGALALLYTGYLLYVGIPLFLNIDRDESLRFSSSTLAIGVLVFEVLLALTVILWGYGPHLF
ncbi:Inner membrane protein YohC [Pantoea ananatis]|nr:Inner membrane protein YohC [Pantoea ananatis]CRH33134.1 Inner membrane protein YohC [Pantoea ananatis]CRH37647.1 Inner membrane protein YohC [Pantoea ananatis]